jgi:hypothetical protein
LLCTVAEQLESQFDSAVVADGFELAEALNPLTEIEYVILIDIDEVK